jgi:phenylacetate-CoA ligase
MAYSSPAIITDNRNLLSDKIKDFYMLTNFTQKLSPDQKDILKKIAAVVPYNWRQSTTYRRWIKFLEQSEYWPEEQIKQWQMQQLKKIIEYAYNNTEGYRQIYKESNVKPADIKTLQDIKKLPFVTKELLRDNIEAFSVKSKKRRYSTTSGSTGIPFGFYGANENSHIENAFVHRGWSWLGWKPGLLTAVLRGGFVGSERQPFQYDAYHKELSLSSYYLTDKTINLYLDAINKYKPKVLAAYPSSLNIFCDILTDMNIKPPSFDFISLESENIYEGQVQKCKELFPESKIFGGYGHSEKVVRAIWCEHSETYHIWPFYGYTEILDKTDKEVKAGGEGEIIGTGFHNFMTPFIRYRTMDIAVKGGNSCSLCKRPFPLLDKILGRTHDVIITSNNRCITAALAGIQNALFENLKQFQLYQEKKGEVIFKYIPKTSFTSNDIERIAKGLKTKLGDDVKVTLKTVKEIPRAKSGKYKRFEQKLPIKYGDNG